LIRPGDAERETRKNNTMTFAIRGLEIHNSRMWRWSAIDSALTFMSANQLNTLILHQNDLLDSLVLPPGYLSAELMYSRWPIHRSTLASNRLYMRQLVAEAGRRGISVYFEVKELWFPDQILEVFPELRSETGAVCPTHPFWIGFLRDKVSELIRAFPELGGVIVSPATRESKATIATRSCSCERCAATPAAEWYEGILGAMYSSLHTHSKTLVVRDFAYSVGEQSVLMTAAQAVSDEIVIALKNVPHDFWPVFPHNPAIGGTGASAQWVEFDVMGQYCGLGVVPCDLVDDIRNRLHHCAEQGVEGVWFRTDWELLNDISVFNSLNLVNLYAGAMLAADPEVADEAVYAAYTTGGLSTALSPESMRRSRQTPTALDAPELVQRYLRATWPIVQKALYTRGHVYQYSSKIAPTLDDFFYVAEKYHGREQWDPGSSNLVTVTRENVREILREKADASQEARKLRTDLAAEQWGIPQDFANDLELTTDLLVWYADLYRHVVSLGFLAALAIQTGLSADQDRAIDAAGEMTTFRQQLAAELGSRHWPYYLFWLFDLDLLAGFESDVRRRLSAVAAASLAIEQ
jgi:hypothetical protein